MYFYFIMEKIIFLFLSMLCINLYGIELKDEECAKAAIKAYLEVEQYNPDQDSQLYAVIGTHAYDNCRYAKSDRKWRKSAVIPRKEREDDLVVTPLSQ